MPRTARVVVAGYPYHVTQRGNNRQDVFFADGDRTYYLELLKSKAGEHRVDVLGYCLMTNHVHLLLLPHKEDSLAKAVGRTHLLDTQYINQLHARSGHLWQGRFYSVVLDDEHLLYALRYLERNPVRARMVRLAWNYAWSSARAHVDGRDRFGLIETTTWIGLSSGIDWRSQLQAPEDDQLLSRLRRNTGP